MNDLSNKILERIEREHLQVKPRWVFVFRGIIFDFGAILAVVFGAVSFGMVINLIVEKQNELHLLNLPFLWIMAVILMLFLAYKILVNISFMYRFRFLANLLIIATISLSGGYLVFAYGKAEVIENKLEEVPVYSQIVSIPEKAQEELEIKKQQQEKYNEIEKNDNDGNGAVNNDGENENNAGKNEADSEENKGSPTKNKNESGDDRNAYEKRDVKNEETDKIIPKENGNTLEKNSESSFSSEEEKRNSEKNTEGNAERNLDETKRLYESSSFSRTKNYSESFQNQENN
jgi:hypothetical protein